MVAAFGINTAGRAEYTPAALAGLGATWTRCVAYPDFDLSPWIAQLHQRGMKALLTLPRESLGDDPERWGQAIEEHRARYAAVGVDAWQLGNEPDGDGPSSWTMTHERLNRLLLIGRRTLGKDALLIGPGLVTGQPSWLDGVDLAQVDAVAVHPYGKNPGAWWRGPAWGSGEVLPLLEAYARYGKRLWITEYGFSDLTEQLQAEYYGVLTTTLLTCELVDAAMPFCYEQAMVRGFGLVDHGARRLAYHAVRQAAILAGSPPPQEKPEPRPAAHYQLGFLEWATLQPELVGLPLEDERGFAAGLSLQPTTNGLLFWVDARDPLAHAYARPTDLAEVYGFKHHDGSLWRWRRGWTQGELV